MRRQNRIGLHVGLAAMGIGLASMAADDWRPHPVVQDAPIETWKKDLRAMADGVWITSNAEYLEEDGGTEEYGLGWTLQPGGLAMTGCLWGERAGTVQVYWRFFQGWDPVRRAGLVYQLHPAGIVGMGYLEEREPGEPGLIQDFRAPDGTMSRTGHIEEWDGPDRRVTRSVDWTGTGWEPRRHYVWVRNRERESPC